MAANASGAEKLARACKAAGVPLVTFSSDLVFDGTLGRPYREDDPTCPSCVYGVSKARAEEQVLGAMGDALVIRTSAFFGPWDQYNFAWNTLTALARGETVTACEKSVVSPTYVPDLCHATLDLLVDGEKGIWHLANQGSLSWYDFAVRVAEGAGFDASRVRPLGTGTPAATVLGSRHGPMMRSLDEAIEDYLREVQDRPELAVSAPAEETMLAAE
jgi:dTDP-4-dehydrorhamnose reductase